MAPSNYSSSLSALILQIQRNPKRSAATKQAAAAPKVLPAGVSSKPADVPKLSTASPGAAGIRRSLKTTQPAHPVKGQEPGNPPTIFQLAVQQRLKRELDKGTAPRNGNGRLHSYMGRLKPVPDSECPSAEAVEQIVLPAALPEEIVEAATEELPVTAAEPEAVSEAAASNEAEATEENETAETGFEFELVAEEVERCLDEAICKGVLHKTLNTWGSSDYTGLRRMEPDRGVRIGKLRLERPDEKERRLLKAQEKVNAPAYRTTAEKRQNEIDERVQSEVRSRASKTPPDEAEMAKIRKVAEEAAVRYLKFKHSLEVQERQRSARELKRELIRPDKEARLARRRVARRERARW